MPKIYEQQITAQATDFSNVNYNKIQDYITPALEHATKTMDKATDALVRIGDSRAARELELAGKEAAEEITNWTDFKELDKTADKMVASGMKRYDNVMSGLDRTVRNRIELYNPKAREIFEVKVKEQAADAMFTYSFKNNMQSIADDSGRLITETVIDNKAENPVLVKNKMLAHLESKKNTMRPADYLVYEQAFQTAVEEGLVEWYITQGFLDMAKRVAESDYVTGDVNEVTRAKWLRNIDCLMKSAKSGSGSGSDSSQNKENFLDYFTADKEIEKEDGTKVIEPGGSASEGLVKMATLSTYAESGAKIPDDMQDYADVVLAGGKTYNELIQMPLSQRSKILQDNTNTAIKASGAKDVVRTRFQVLLNEYNDVIDSEGNLNAKADISRLKALMHSYDTQGFGNLLLAWPDNRDMKDQYEKIKNIISKEQAAQDLALSKIGTNMSFATNNPHMAGFFDAPSTKEQAKVFNTPEYAQKSSQIRLANGVIEALNIASSDSLLPNYADLSFYGKQESKASTPIKYDEMGNAIVENTSPLKDFFVDAEKLAKLDSLEEQTLYLNEMVYPTGVIEKLASKGYVLSSKDMKENDSVIKHLIAANELDEGKVTRAEDIQAQLNKALDEGIMSEQRHAELSRYVYDLSQGRPTRTFPCLFPSSVMPLGVWNQCLAANGLGTVKNTVEYDPYIDEGWHDSASLLRRATKTKFESGEVGDVAQLITVFILESVKTGNEEHFGIPSGKAASLTFNEMRDVYNQVEGFYSQRDEQHNLVDLTNNSSLYSMTGKEVDGKTWNPANPLPETTTDLKKSKQYEMLGVFEDVLSQKFGTQIQFSEEMKMHIAENVRRVSKGKRESTKGISAKELKELTHPKANMNYERLTGE
jgi:hypothetical protein